MLGDLELPIRRTSIHTKRDLAVFRSFRAYLDRAIGSGMACSGYIGILIN